MMYDVVAFRPSTSYFSLLFRWPYFCLRALINQVVWLWQKTYGPQDVVKALPDISFHNVRFLSAYQLSQIGTVSLEDPKDGLNSIGKHVITMLQSCCSGKEDGRITRKEDEKHFKKLMDSFSVSQLEALLLGRANDDASHRFPIVDYLVQTPERMTARVAGPLLDYSRKHPEKVSKHAMERLFSMLVQCLQEARSKKQEAEEPESSVSPSGTSRVLLSKERTKAIQEDAAKRRNSMSSEATSCGTANGRAVILGDRLIDCVKWIVGHHVEYLTEVRMNSILTLLDSFQRVNLLSVVRLNEPLARVVTEYIKSNSDSYDCGAVCVSKYFGDATNLYAMDSIQEDQYLHTVAADHLDRDGTAIDPKFDGLIDQIKQDFLKKPDIIKRFNPEIVQQVISKFTLKEIEAANVQLTPEQMKWVRDS